MVEIPTSGKVRLDAWLWAVRIYKTRSAATTACRAGHVRLNGDPVKASQAVVSGDRIRVRKDGFDRDLEVSGLISKRVGAPVAAKCYIDHTPPPKPAESGLSPIIERFLDDNGEVAALADVERALIVFALEHYSGRMSRVARALGIGRSTLYRKLKEYGLEGEAESDAA